ncbi:TRAP transporter small permease [Mesorhizobium sp. SB112]|uniref:TRAP transporter small permease n=1 Tax=Mesorhizobium sp. SB112 TaxID=3151853 RepID=UPI0032630FC1
MLSIKIDRTLAGIVRLLARIELHTLAVLMIFIVGSIALQTFTRYAFGRPITWVEEAGVYAFIWVTFVGAAYGAKQGKLIKVELISHSFGEAGLRRILMISQVFMIAGCGYLAWITPSVIAIEGRSSTISLPIDVPRAWFYSVPLFYFACVTTFSSLVRLHRLAILKDFTPLVAPFSVEEQVIPATVS